MKINITLFLFYILNILTYPRIPDSIIEPIPLIRIIRQDIIKQISIQSTASNQYEYEIASLVFPNHEQVLAFIDSAAVEIASNLVGYVDEMLLFIRNALDELVAKQTPEIAEIVTAGNNQIKAGIISIFSKPPSRSLQVNNNVVAKSSYIPKITASRGDDKLTIVKYTRKMETEIESLINNHIKNLKSLQLTPILKTKSLNTKEAKQLDIKSINIEANNYYYKENLILQGKKVLRLFKEKFSHIYKLGSRIGIEQNKITSPKSLGSRTVSFSARNVNDQKLKQLRTLIDKVTNNESVQINNNMIANLKPVAYEIKSMLWGYTTIIQDDVQTIVDPIVEMMNNQIAIDNQSIKDQINIIFATD